MCVFVRRSFFPFHPSYIVWANVHNIYSARISKRTLQAASKRLLSLLNSFHWPGAVYTHIRMCSVYVRAFYATYLVYQQFTFHFIFKTFRMAFKFEEKRKEKNRNESNSRALCCVCVRVCEYTYTTFRRILWELAHEQAYIEILSNNIYAQSKWL